MYFPSRSSVELPYEKNGENVPPRLIALQNFGKWNKIKELIIYDDYVTQGCAKYIYSVIEG